MVDSTPEDMSALVEEYRTLLSYVREQSPDLIEPSPDELSDALVLKADWTPMGAAHLVRLVHDYGSFVLRNACALSLAMGIEDGELGL